jgi:type I restriction enzyme M protein
VYDLRTNMPSFGKRTPFTEQHLQPFETVYGVDPHGLSPRPEGEWSFNAEEAEVADSEENKNIDQHQATSRWRKFSREWIRIAKSDSLDISWLKDKDSIDADSLPEPDVLAAEAMTELVQAMGELDALMRELGAGDEADAQRQLLNEAFGEVKE